jgi:hypothetical protein
LVVVLMEVAAQDALDIADVADGDAGCSRPP